MVANHNTEASERESFMELTRPGNGHCDQPVQVVQITDASDGRDRVTPIFHLENALTIETVEALCMNPVWSSTESAEQIEPA